MCSKLSFTGIQKLKSDFNEMKAKGLKDLSCLIKEGTKIFVQKYRHL